MTESDREYCADSGDIADLFALAVDGMEAVPEGVTVN